MLKKFSNFMTKVHRDERGIEALQVVMIVAIAALILFFFKNYWEEVRDWCQPRLDELTGWTAG